MITITYLLVAAGFRESGCGFFDALTWPAIVGRMLAERAKREGAL